LLILYGLSSGLIFMDIYKLLNPTKSTENLNQSFNNPQGPDNPQPIIPGDNHQSDNLSDDDKIRKDIINKLQACFPARKLDKEIGIFNNIFNDTGKFHDLTKQEKIIVTEAKNIKECSPVKSINSKFVMKGASVVAPLVPRVAPTVRILYSII
jgi:hypothetical protein